MDDLSQARPCLLPGVRVTREVGGQGGARWIVHASGGRCFQAGEPEASLLALMDGTRGLEELSRDVAGAAPRLDAADVARFVRRLVDAGLVSCGAEAPQVLRPFSSRVVIANAAAMLPLCRLLHRIPAWVRAFGVAALLVAGAVLGAQHAGWLRALYSEPEVSRLLALAFLVWILGLTHEMAHAAAALTAGARAAALVVEAAPWSIGFRVHLAGAALLPPRARARIAAWGPLCDAAVGSVALIAGLALPAQREAAALLAAAALLRVAWNLLPVPGTDGAYLINLGARALRAAARSAMDRR